MSQTQISVRAAFLIKTNSRAAKTVKSAYFNNKQRNIDDDAGRISTSGRPHAGRVFETPVLHASSESVYIGLNFNYLQ